VKGVVRNCTVVREKGEGGPHRQRGDFGSRPGAGDTPQPGPSTNLELTVRTRGRGPRAGASDASGGRSLRSRFPEPACCWSRLSAGAPQCGAGQTRLRPAAPRRAQPSTPPPAPAYLSLPPPGLAWDAIADSHEKCRFARTISAFAVWNFSLPFPCPSPAPAKLRAGCCEAWATRRARPAVGATAPSSLTPTQADNNDEVAQAPTRSRSSACASGQDHGTPKCKVEASSATAGAAKLEEAGPARTGSRTLRAGADLIVRTRRSALARASDSLQTSRFLTAYPVARWPTVRALFTLCLKGF
jgi:hypothetical protein